MDAVAVVDTSRVGLLAAELMESIAEEHGDDVELGVVAVVVEIDIPPSTDEEYGATLIEMRCSDKRRWIQAGLFERAKAIAFSAE
jgi:hypothetical protein